MGLLEALSVLGTDFGNLEAFGAVTGFCREQWWVPVATCGAYLAMVYAAREPLAQHRYLKAVDRCFAGWNLALSLFSCWGFWQMAWTLSQQARWRGLQFTICGASADVASGSMDKPMTLALCLFCFSKIPELGDTVFLVLKCKRVRFLQWYHHATVLLFCWLALATEYTPGLWFAATNYFVHSVMYMYFCLMTFPATARWVKPVAPLITVVQILQMVWGLVVNAIAVGTYLAGGACQIQGVTVYCAVLMYASYFYLFGQLLFEARGGGHKDRRQLARAVSRKVSAALLGEAPEESSETHLKVN
eukprot:SRR837773.27736.p2 GENE.SRR837773.27736~~SRR837773.27736.p2  ORF type:complete len:324 (-),score=127.96 SRR837773.27736:330-1238(-)